MPFINPFVSTILNMSDPYTEPSVTDLTFHVGYTWLADIVISLVYISAESMYVCSTDSRTLLLWEFTIISAPEIAPSIL